MPHYNKMFRLLVLGGGKRVGLVQNFRSSAIKSGFNFSCFAYENSTLLPISLEAEIIIGRAWDDPKIIDDLKEIIVEKKIDWVCACVDQATLLLDKLKNTVLSHLETSSNIACKKVLDKRTANVMAKNSGLAIIPDSQILPLFVKPIVGSASKGACVIETNYELEEFKKKIHEIGYMFQQLCLGDEYTVDCFSTSEIVYASPRKRIQTVDGEVLITQTIERQDLVDQAVKFIRTAELFGPITIQFIEHENNTYFMECNPRFGGGVLCSIKKGFNYPAICIAIAKKRERPKFTLKSQIIMSRYFAESYFSVDG